MKKYYKLLSLFIIAPLCVSMISGCEKKAEVTGVTEKIGIIGAMDEEVASLKREVQTPTVTNMGGMEFCEGTLDGKNVVIVKCGVGKVNAGTCAQLLINVFGATSIINTGIAGSLNNDINIGDYVISTDAVQYDYDVSPLGFKRGEFYETGESSLPADESMRKRAVEAVKTCAPEVGVFEGRICTGDQFVSTAEQKNSITGEFGGMCCEMEGGAIAQICCNNNVPFVIIRAISDKADGSANVDYTQFEHEAAERCAAVTRYMLSH